MTRLDAKTSKSLGIFSLEEIHKSNSNFLTELVCEQQTDTYQKAGRAGKEVRLDGYSYTELAIRNASGIVKDASLKRHRPARVRATQ